LKKSKINYQTKKRRGNARVEIDQIRGQIEEIKSLLINQGLKYNFITKD
jgi:hypothetical protein